MAGNLREQVKFSTNKKLDFNNKSFAKEDKYEGQNLGRIYLISRQGMRERMGVTCWYETFSSDILRHSSSGEKIKSFPRQWVGVQTPRCRSSVA